MLDFVYLGGASPEQTSEASVRRQTSALRDDDVHQAADLARNKRKWAKNNVVDARAGGRQDFDVARKVHKRYVREMGAGAEAGWVGVFLCCAVRCRVACRAFSQPGSVQSGGRDPTAPGQWGQRRGSAPDAEHEPRRCCGRLRSADAQPAASWVFRRGDSRNEAYFIGASRGEDGLIRPVF